MRGLIVIAIMCLAGLLITACGGRAYTTGRPVIAIDESARYRLVLYHSYEGETNLYMAALDIEGDEYTITPYAVKDQYSVIEGLKPADAMARAEAHMRRADGFNGMELREIAGAERKIIGYEALPLLLPFGSGRAETPVVNYFSSGREPGVVSFIVRLRLERGPLLMDQKRWQ